MKRESGKGLLLANTYNQTLAHHIHSLSISLMLLFFFSYPYPPGDSLASQAPDDHESYSVSDYRKSILSKDLTARRQGDTARQTHFVLSLSSLNHQTFMD